MEINRILVLSDTHGNLRPEVLAAAQSAREIFHAGDVGKEAVLNELRQTGKPLHAVRGNVDAGILAQKLPAVVYHQTPHGLILVLHNLEELDLNPKAAGVAVVISGHSHVPSICEEDGILYLNPGSCGPKRFDLPVSWAWLAYRDGAWRAELETLV